MENKLPLRFDYEYTKIKFEQYEYTNFITYALARRNANVMSLLTLQFELLIVHNTLPLSFSGYKSTEATEEILEGVKEIEEWLKDTMLGLLGHYNKNQFSDEINNLTLENMREIFSNIINKVAEELYDKYYIIYQNDTELLQRSAKELYDPLIYLERDRFLTEHMNRVYYGEENHKNNYNINHAENEYFVVYQEIPKNQKYFSFNVIYPKFKTAMRDFTDTMVALNLNLSEDELIDYIKKIKKNYDSKNSIIKTKRELLEEELKVFDNDSDILDSTKWADNFYIYDYFLYHQAFISDKKESEIKKEIQLELTKFHGVKILKDTNEMKNSKDTKYKLISWEEYLKLNEDYDDMQDDYIGVLDNEKAYISIKSIENKYKLIKKYIEGDNPLYKTLLER